MTTDDKILNLAKQLYPSGRAFKMPKGGVAEALQKALADSESVAYTEVGSILDSILPDNDGFTSEDILLWELRLAIKTDLTLSDTQRKENILSKMGHPGIIFPRQSLEYIEYELQAAGFNVYVHRYNGVAVPSDVYGVDVQYGQILYGQASYGQKPQKIIANNDTQPPDQFHNVGGGDYLRNAFYIGGATWPNLAEITLAEEKDFRTLVLKLKPVGMAAFLLTKTEILLIDAITDDFYSLSPPIVGSVGGIIPISVLANDTLGGNPANLNTVSISILTPASDPRCWLNTSTGFVHVDAGCPAGTYAIDYKITQKGWTNSDPSIIIVYVT